MHSEVAPEYYCPARLLDGRSAIEQTVELRIGNEGLGIVFTDGHQERFSWSELRLLEKGATADHITFGNGYMVSYTSPTARRMLSDGLASRRSGWGKGLAWLSSLHWRKLGVVALISISCAVAAFYFSFVNAYRLVPDTYDRYLGRQAHTRFFGSIDTCGGTALDSFKTFADSLLYRQGDLFEPQLSIVAVTDTNAFALPGGRIYLLNGLLKESHSPDEVLAVLAHERSHAERRHGVQQLLRNAGTTFVVTLVIGGVIEGFDLLEHAENAAELGTSLAMLRYSRSFEKQADADAAKRLVELGIKPTTLDSLLQRIAPAGHGLDTLFNVFSSHPDSRERSILLAGQAMILAKSPPAGLDHYRKDWTRIKNSCVSPRDPEPLWRQILLP